MAYVEDIFSDFYFEVLHSRILVQHQDRTACLSFYNIIEEDKEFTQAQSKYLLKILDKYKVQMSNVGIDHSAALINPVWKKQFRLLDLTKRIYVETEGTKIWVCLKHPFSYKDLFEKEVLKKTINESSIWDPELKIRKYNIYDINLILLYEFAKKYTFEIDDTVIEALALVEQIWQDADLYNPYFVADNNNVTLCNATESIKTYFEKHKTEKISNNLLLAKSLGMILQHSKSTTIAEKIASTPVRRFWTNEQEKLFELYKSIDGIVCVLINEERTSKQWLENFVDTAVRCGVDKSEIKVCFRSNNNDDPQFNLWVKNNNLGGQVESGRIIIFKNKPAKWLFKNEKDVKLIVVNTPFLPSSALAQNWVDNHPCMVYLTDIKPSVQKDITVVEL